MVVSCAARAGAPPAQSIQAATYPAPPARIVSLCPATVLSPQVFNLYPVLKIQLTTATHTARKPSVAPALTSTLTSATP